MTELFLTMVAVFVLGLCLGRLVMYVDDRLEERARHQRKRR